MPSTWNAGPRDEEDEAGPYEASLVDKPVADPEQPLEVLRTVHSFDPCLACAIHLVDTDAAAMDTSRRLILVRAALERKALTRAVARASVSWAWATDHGRRGPGRPCCRGARRAVGCPKA